MSTSFCVRSDEGSLKLDGYVSEHTVTYLGINTDYSSGDSEILSDWLSFNGAGMGSVHPVDTRAILTGLTAARSDNVQERNKWIVKATWSSKAPDPDKNKEDPTDMAPKASWSFEEQDIFLEKDLDDSPIVNSAFEGLLNPPAIKNQIPVLRVEVNQLPATFNSARMRAVSGHVNNAVWNGWPIETVLCTGADAQEDYQKDIGKYWKVIYTFKFQTLIINNSGDMEPLTWQALIKDAGFNEYEGLNANNTRKYRRIRDDATGEPVAEPYPLKAGLKLKDTEDIVYLTFSTYPTATFATYFPWTL